MFVLLCLTLACAADTAGFYDPHPLKHHTYAPVKNPNGIFLRALQAIPGLGPLVPTIATCLIVGIPLLILLNKVRRRRH